MYRHDLAALTADLPPTDPAVRPAGRGTASARGWWVRARTAAVRLGRPAMTMFSAWSPRRRLAVAVTVGLLLIVIGLSLWSFHGRGGGRPRR